jgi:transposase
LHIKVDALGNPLKLLLSAGQEADVTYGPALLEGGPGEATIADKGYDSNDMVKAIEASGSEVVIPPKANRTEQREYDKHLYKERNLVERFINRIKQNRRVATRYDKTPRNYLAFCYLASILVLLL